MKIKYSIIIVLLIVISTLYFYSYNKDVSNRNTIINNTTNNICNRFDIIDANTIESREKGLGGMDKLSDNSIMLFTFDHSDNYGFWMKDMKFPIDIIWLDEDYKIIHIEEKVSPESYPKIFYPGEKSLYVIEMNAGFAKKYDIKLNDIFNPKKNCK